MARPGIFRALSLTLTLAGLLSIGVAAASEEPNEYQGATHTIGRIPDFNSWGTRPIKFRVVPAVIANGKVVFSVDVDPQPLGPLTIDPKTGDFSYAPDPSDRRDLHITVKASPRQGSAGRAESQDVMLIRWPVLPPEYSLVSPPRGGSPDPESVNYVATGIEKQLTEGAFNTVDRRTTRTVRISGKTIVFQKGHRNGLYELLHCADAESSAGGDVRNSDIKALTVMAETVIIRSPLRLPRTNVTIFGKELIFEDQDPTTPALIDTTPLSYKIRANQLQAGHRGEDAGGFNLVVLALKVRAMPGTLNTGVKRFILRGARGQDGGFGQPGADGPKMKDYYPRYTPPGSSLAALAPPGTVLILTANGTLLVGERRWPDGQPATPGGAPGNGGSGGTLQVLGPHDLRPDIVRLANTLLDTSPGQPGAKPPRALGGKPGTPAHARWIKIGVPGQWIIAEHNAVAGSDAAAPDPNLNEKGKPGRLTELEAGDLDWLQPAALQAVLALAKDAYLDNQFDAARGALSIYKTILVDPAKYPKPSAQELVRLRSEIDLLLHRLDSNLDYFGNPPGWVPMLSFQVNMAAYSQEITSSIRLLFLCRLVNKKASQLAMSAVSLRTTLGDLSVSINREAREYNDLQDRLPALRQQLAVILDQQKEVDRIVREKDDQLKAMAVGTVEERHRAAFLKMALNVIATATKVVPVFQPALAAVGTAISALENIQSDPVGSLETGAIAPVPRISTKSGPFSPGEWLESLPGSARGY